MENRGEYPSTPPFGGYKNHGEEYQPDVGLGSKELISYWKKDEIHYWIRKGRYEKVASILE